MRVKQLWRYVPLPAKLKLIYNRLTLSHITTAYFILALIHCVLQIVWQTQAVNIERTQSVVLQRIISAGNVTEKFAALDSDDYIELCHAIPGQSSDRNPCKTFSGVKHGSNSLGALGEGNGSGNGGDGQPNHSNKDEHHKNRRSASGYLHQLAIRAPTFTGHVGGDGMIDGVSVSGLDGLPPVVLNNQCTDVLAWPDQIVDQAKREALAMIAFQLWLFGISIVAILNESIPHVLAALATHILSTGWASFQIARTEHFGERFTDIVTNGACGGVDLMPTYWKTKIDNQIPILVLNGASLLVSSFLSWKLFKQYGVQSFNRVGASPRMHRIYLLVLVLSVSLQLTAFFLITSLALWIEQLLDGPIAPLAQHRTIYLGVFIATAVLIIPWLCMGWIAVRRERRHMMLAFLFTSVLLIAAQTGMFISPVYRLTFSTWTFFATLTVAAYILLVGTFVMAVVCRSLFGRGLAHFLQVQETLEECDFTPVYFEHQAGDGQGEQRVVEDEKGPMPWDEDPEVRKISLRVRGSEERSVQDISPAQIREPPRVYNEAANANAVSARVKVRFADQEHPARPHVVSPTANERPTLATPPPQVVELTITPPPDERSPTPGHKRESSSGTWYKQPIGRDFIQRGVNEASPVKRGFNITNPGRPVVGLPASVRPIQPRRPPGLTIVTTPRVPAGTYAPGRI